jgi:hypothetical protein
MFVMCRWFQSHPFWLKLTRVEAERWQFSASFHRQMNIHLVNMNKENHMVRIPCTLNSIWSVQQI